MITIALKDGTEISKVVAERIYHSLRDNYRGMLYEIDTVVDAINRNKRDSNGLIRGEALINQQEFLSFGKAANYSALEQASIISDFNVDTRRTYKTTHARNRVIDRCPFTVPKDVEAVMRNMFLSNEHSRQPEKPSWDKRFLKQITEYECAR